MSSGVLEKHQDELTDEERQVFEEMADEHDGDAKRIAEAVLQSLEREEARS